MTKQPTSTIGLTTAAIRQMQEQKLQALLAYLQQHSPYYKEMFARHHIAVEEIKTLEDLTRIPVTGKEELQQRLQSISVGYNDPRSLLHDQPLSGSRHVQSLVLFQP